MFSVIKTNRLTFVVIIFQRHLNIMLLLNSSTLWEMDLVDANAIESFPNEFFHAMTHCYTIYALKPVCIEYHLCTQFVGVRIVLSIVLYFTSFLVLI